jgi:hypothetical protein
MVAVRFIHPYNQTSCHNLQQFPITGIRPLSPNATPLIRPDFRFTEIVSTKLPISREATPLIRSRFIAEGVAFIRGTAVNYDSWSDYRDGIW